jgi:hypothetical protein
MVSPGLGSGLLIAATMVATPERAVLLEADFEPAEVYVQAQSVYRLRLYQAIDVRDLTFSVTAPRLADLRPIGQGRVYESLRDGRRYRVHERNYSIRPFTSGALLMSAVHVEGRVPASGTPDGRRTLRVEAPMRTLKVWPVPSKAGAAPWLPAHKLSVSEIWAPAQQLQQVGQAQRRSIRIEAVGVEAEQLPELQIAAPGMAVHAEPARLENHFAGALNIGVREQTFNMVALRAGTIIVPEFQLSWWNIDSNLPSVVTLPLRTLQIAPASGLASAPTLAAMATVLAKPRHSHLLPGAAALLCCIAALVWYRRTRIGAAWRLTHACRTGDLRGVRDGLLDWMEQVRPQTVVLTLGRLAERLDEPTARQALGELERQLYGPAPSAADPAALAATVRSVKRAVRRDRRRRGS